MTTDGKYDDRLDPFAEAFLGLFREHRADEGLRGPFGALSLEDAYEVQRRVIAARTAGGEAVVGYKVGCTSRAIRQQFGLSEAISGRLMSPHVYEGKTDLDCGAFFCPAVEPEFVLVMGRDLSDGSCDDKTLVDAVDFVSPGIEVHNFCFWFGEPTSQELVASNGLHACLVVGGAKCRPTGSDWGVTEGVGLWKNGELTASGIGAEIMGGPLASLRWLVNHLVRHGDSLRAGQLVIPGSPVGIIPVAPGDRVAARFTTVGQVEIAFR